MTRIRKILATSATATILAMGVVACEEQHPQVVPGDAQLVESGNQKGVYTASHEGMVYVYDQQSNRLIWSGNVHRDDKISVDPSKNEITRNGQVVGKGTLTPYHTEQFWFEQKAPDERPSSNYKYEYNTYTTPSNSDHSNAD